MGRQPATRLREGYARLAADDAAGAKRIASELLAREPSLTNAHLLQAQATAELGEWEGALASIDNFLAAAGEHAEACFIRGTILERLNRPERALEDFARALTIDPQHAAALDRKGALHDVRGEFELALACARQLVALDPADAQAHRKLGMTLRELGRFAEAAASLQTAAALDPRVYDARATLALTQIDLGQFEQADAVLTQLLGEAADHAQARWARAVSNLLRGRFDVAWDDYEWRESRLDAPVRFPTVPRWDGAPIDNGYLLLSAEQGLGDQIMFASCVQDALRLAPACIIECDSKLVGLFRRSFPAARVFPGSPMLTPKWVQKLSEPIVAQLPLGSLPALFRRDRSRFPEHGGYLVPDPAAVARWRERLDRLGPGLKVGLSWTGGAAKTRRHLRSLALEQLLPVLRTGNCRFVSLQYVDSRAELAAMQDRHQLEIHDLDAARLDYDETGALVGALDLVISVCTSIVHLAGSIGKPVWIMAPAAPEWRYMAWGQEMPWYPSAIIWRQRRLGDWNEVVSAITVQLEAFCNAQAPNRTAGRGAAS